jgi:cytochrome b6-f complex iron-sulfur subunit
MSEPEKLNRRDWLAALLMRCGLGLSYGFLAVQAVLFLLPKRLQARTRSIFAGPISQFKIGEVQKVFDLEGHEILVKRDAKGLAAFSTVCPHLGCRVHWMPDQQRFFCPCHNGIFNSDGQAISGPPADAGQSLNRVPLRVDEKSGTVYLEVKDPVAARL